MTSKNDHERSRMTILDKITSIDDNWQLLSDKMTCYNDKYWYTRLFFDKMTCYNEIYRLFFRPNDVSKQQLMHI